MTSHRLLFATLAFTHAAAFAQASAAPPRDETPLAVRPEVGATTRTWLDLQRSGRAAAPGPGVTGEAATLAKQRYLDSYKLPIPQAFDSPVREAGERR